MKPQHYLLLLLGAFLPSLTVQGSEPADSASVVKESELFRLDALVRLDWQYDRQDDKTNDSNTGFQGKYIMLRADGKIIDGLIYSWRQRINKIASDRNIFDATDWIYLNYAHKDWNFQAGKEIVAIGGYEYDRAPFDLYGCSVFWQNINCYELGVSAAYQIDNSNSLMAQITQSPNFTSDCRNMYAYNLMWNAHYGNYSAIWSANMIEASKGKYINYLALGNKFDWQKWQFELDLMNRAASHQAFLFRDCSVMAEAAYNPNSRWKIHAKYTYDVNRSGNNTDFTVADGTHLNMAGAGVEFYPILKDRTTLRLHAALYYSWGKNANTADLMQDNTLFASIGLTWNINFLNIRK